jgi:hypothetical protein
LPVLPDEFTNILQNSNIANDLIHFSSSTSTFCFDVGWRCVGKRGRHRAGRRDFNRYAQRSFPLFSLGGQCGTAVNSMCCKSCPLFGCYLFLFNRKTRIVKAWSEVDWNPPTCHPTDDLPHCTVAQWAACRIDRKLSCVTGMTVTHNAQALLALKQDTWSLLVPPHRLAAIFSHHLHCHGCCCFYARAARATIHRHGWGGRDHRGAVST